MTTNNKVKAPRPCTLWGQTFDSNLVESITRKHYMDKNGNFLDSILVEKHYGGRSLAKIRGLEYGIKAFQEALQAIASAQRPWLKVEGFEGGNGTVVELLYKDGSRCFGKFDGINSFITTWSDGHVYYQSKDLEESDLETTNINHFKAFKPISDSQEAWDEVAGVEVWERVV